MPTATVNQQTIEFAADERLNCIQAAKRVGFEIPHYCWHPELSVVASCRMCLVEVGERKPDGTVVMQPKLVPGCQTPVREGTVIVADSPKVKQAQQATLEYLLLNHPLDCPTCDQAGECFLQDYSFKYGRGYSRLQEAKNQKPDKTHIGEQITLFTDRCIMCTRCVRFTREVSGTAELQVTNRGTHEEIDIFPGHPCNNKLAGNVVDLCPVGALCSKDFLYKQRVWWLNTAKSVCPNCSTGCSIDVDQNEGQVYRLTPRSNPCAQGEFMCDDGRFGWKYLHSPDRLSYPEQRTMDRVVSRAWDDILPALRKALATAGKNGAPARIGAVLSPWMTVEEAYLLATTLRGLTDNLQLAMGPVYVVGEDDHYPKNIRNEASADPKFTIRAEKCPNRFGVDLIVKNFTKSPLTFASLLAKAKSGKFDALYLVGGDPAGWITEEEALALEATPLLVVQDILPTPASAMATFVLPGGSFAERDGVFVNHAGLAQEIRRSIPSPEGARPDQRILWDLAGRIGLFNGPALRAEIAAQIPALAALGVGTLGDLGVWLDQSAVAEPPMDHLAGTAPT